MRFKKAQSKLLNLPNYLIILAIVGIFFAVIVGFGQQLQNNTNAALSDDSNAYINNLAGVEVTDFDDDLESPIEGNKTGTLFDYALEFFFGQRKAEAVKNFVYNVVSLPTTIVTKLFRFSLGEWQWILTILDWLYRAMIFFALIYFIRNR